MGLREEGGGMIDAAHHDQHGSNSVSYTVSVSKDSQIFLLCKDGWIYRCDKTLTQCVQIAMLPLEGR